MRSLEHAATAAADTAVGTATPTRARERMVARGRIVVINKAAYTIVGGRLHWYDNTQPHNERWQPDMTREEILDEIAELQAKLDLYETPSEQVPAFAFWES